MFIVFKNKTLFINLITTGVDYGIAPVFDPLIPINYPS